MSNKIALVTGASRGIGAAILEKLLSLGYTVIGTATTPEGADNITRRIASLSGVGTGMMLNIQNTEDVQRVVDNIQSTYGTVSVLVNNAGITRDNLFIRMKEAEWDAVLDTNLTGVFRVTQACIKGMMKARFGRIVSIGSIVGTLGNPGQANYCAAKAGLIGFSKSLARELGSRGITANVVAPGFIDTDMTAALTDSQKESWISQIPAQRLGRPEDIAAAVAFLASEDAGYITGETLHVNGGMLMG